MGAGGAGARLLRAGRPVTTVFDLLGDDENDMTAALGYLLAQTPEARRAVIADLAPESAVAARAPVSSCLVAIRLQTARPDAGITDLEIVAGDDLFVVIEAKRGRVLPAVAQLAQYAPVVSGSGATHRMLVTLTSLEPPAAAAAAAAGGYGAGVAGVPVVHRSWRHVRSLVRGARAGETHAGKRLIDHFIAYLDAILGMDTRYSNMVYVVSLGASAPEGWQLAWRDIVRKRRRYFYPASGGKGGWPEPPNYIAFRYDGRLQHIHHVEAATMFTNPRHVFPEAPDQDWGPHHLLTLGPPIVPPKPVLNGPRVQQSARVWCMLDTLLTAETVSDALTETEHRRAV